MNIESIRIAGRPIGPGHPCYVIAEMSANHNHDFARAVATIHAAADAGADAIKLQTYTADTITLNCDAEPFVVRGGTLWDGATLHQLYQQASMPWDWQPRLKAVADQRGIALFSTPFDDTAVDFLERMDVPAHKVASFELIDHGLLATIAATGKPVIASTGMASLDEIREAVAVLRRAGCTQLALLRCVSTYPAVPAQMNLATIPHLSETFGVPAGLSDHSLDAVSSIAAVALGACIIEKHFTLRRADGGPDSAFSLEPDELAHLVRSVRDAQAAIGCANYDLDPASQVSRRFRRSLFIVADVKAGERLTTRHVRSIRPADGLEPRHLPQVLQRRALRDLPAGTPLAWDMIEPLAGEGDR